MNSVHTDKVLQDVRRRPPPYSQSGPYLAGGGQGSSSPPPVIVEKVPFLRAGALFLMPNHHQQGALLNLGLPPPPSNSRLRTAMPICARDTFNASYNVTLAYLQENIVKTCEGHMEWAPLTVNR